MTRRLIAFVLVTAALGAPAAMLHCAISCEQSEAIAAVGDVPPCHHADSGGVRLGRVPAPCGQAHGTSSITRFEPQADRFDALAVVDTPGHATAGGRSAIAPGIDRPFTSPSPPLGPHLPLRL